MLVKDKINCVGCPLYEDGAKSFVPDEIIKDSSVLILGQNPGSEEARQSKPFCGPTGELMVNHFMPLAHLSRGENVSIGNVLKCRWQKTDKLPPEPILAQAIEHCTTHHLRVPASTKLVIAEGAIAASWCAGQPTKVYRWRGHVLHPTRPELPTTYVVEHLASVLRDPKQWWVAEIDWRKAIRTAHSWLQVIPPRVIATPDNWELVLQWYVQTTRSAACVAIDTEFIGRPFGITQPVLTMIGLGWVDEHGRVHGLQLDCRAAEPWMKASFYQHLRELVKQVPVLFQNFAADMPILKRCAGVQYESYKQVDDQMLAHAVLYCELAHDLEFLTSIYGGYYKIKHLGDYDIPEDVKWESLRGLVRKGYIEPVDGDTPDLLYNWGDVIEPLMIWEHLRKAFEMDQAAYQVYRTQSIGLIPILLKSMERGIKVNKPRVIQAKQEYESKVKSAQILAESYYGKPINLGSDDQVAYYCYQERGYPVQHHRKSKNPTVDEDAIATLRDHVGPDVDTQVPLSLDLALIRIEQGADPILEARVLYQEAQHSLDSYIYGLVASVYNEQDDSRKKKARGIAKQKGFTEADVVERVYPNFAIHAQKNARWSTTNPPLAQLPGDLRDIVIPDDGECWLHWDWKGMELHFLEVHSGSRILKQAHNEGIDLHTWTMCKMFGFQLPPNLKAPFTAPENAEWRDRYSLRSSSDPRRIFSKSARFECVPLDTQMLTHDGWKYYNELTIGEEVLVYNQQTNHKEWGTLLNILETEGETTLFGQRSWRVEATANHRWFVRKRTWSGRAWKTAPYMSEIQEWKTCELNTECNLIVNAPMVYEEGTATNLNQPKYGTNWVQEVCHMGTKEREAFIKGFALADGHYRDGKWLIDQNDGDIWDAILTACFIQYGTHIQASGPFRSRECKRINISKKAHVTMQEARHVQVGHKRVWCPTTSHGSWVMRQGDTITITGNCNYGGTGSVAASKAIRMGLGKVEVQQALNNLLTADIDYYKWRQDIERQVKASRIIRTFTGRPRRFLAVSKDHGTVVPPKVVREALDYKMQAGVSDVANLTIIEVAKQYPQLLMAWTMHDAQYYHCPVSAATPELIEGLKAIATRQYTIEGRTKAFPIDFDIVYPP